MFPQKHLIKYVYLLKYNMMTLNVSITVEYLNKHDVFRGTVTTSSTPRTTLNFLRQFYLFVDL